MHKTKPYHFIFCIFFISPSFKNIFAQKPTISSFSPSKGNIGSTVAISGTNFSSTTVNNVVYFGDVKANVLTATTTSLTVAVPAGASYKPISVTVNNLTAYSTLPFNVTFPGDGNNFTANSFSTRMDSSWGFGVNDVGATDLDGDGDVDPVLVSTTSNFISVLKHNSSVGSISLPYSASLNFPSSSPFSISFGDMDGDSRQDVIVVNFSVNTLSVFKNNSTIDSIKLLPKIDLGSGTNPALSIVSDIDNDGKPDIVCTNTASNSISVFRNTSAAGVISFAPKMDFTTGRFPFGITSADIDGDGVLEIIVANEDDFTISIFKNNSSPGTISFAPKVDIANVNPVVVKAADLDDDGKPDIIATSINSASVRVLRNTSSPGNFSFALPQQIPTGFGNPIHLSMGDIDGDGKTDIMVDHANYTTLSILRNLSTPGTFAFSSNTDFSSASFPSNFLLTDLDNDARPDIVSSHSTNTAISILRNLVPKPIITSFTPSSGGNGAVVTISGNNFNTASQVNFGTASASSFIVQSSTTILAVVDTGSTGDVTVTTAYGVANRSGFNFNKAPTITSFTPTSGGTATLVTIIGTNLNSTTAVNFGNTPATNFTIVSPTLITATVPALSPGNFDVSVANGFGTAVSGSFYTGITITSFYPTSGPVGTTVTINGTHFSSTATDNIVYFGSVRATVISATQTSLLVSVPTGSTYQPITVTVNNLTAYSREPFVVTFKGTGNEFTTTSFGDRVDSAAGIFPVHATIADLNADGKPDVIVSNFASSMSVSKNTSSNGSVSFQRKVDYNLENSALSSSVGDLNGDGKPDIVALKAQYGVSFDRPMYVFKNVTISDSILLSMKEYSIGILSDTPQYPVINDFDGDGKPDVAVLTYSDIAILRNTSTVDTITFASKKDIGFGQVLASSIAIGDIDGDGKPDIVITADNFENIFVFRNTSKPGDISFAQKVMIETGFSPASVALGDLDNDGRQDIVALNRGNNSFSTYRNISTAGNIAFDGRLNFPLNVVPRNLELGDLDGDGRVDVSFVANGMFIYVIKNTSSGGNISFAEKISYDDPYTPGNVFIADMNNDGKVDILATNASNGNNFSVLINKCQDDGLAAVTIRASGPTTFCQGGSVILKTNSINNASYQWYKDGTAITAANDSIITVNAAGIYSVKITNNSTVSASAPYVVSVKPLPPAAVLSITGTGNLCQGAATFIHSSTQVGIEWYKNNTLLAGITDSVYRVNYAGQYKVIANSNGCLSAFSNEITIAINTVPSPTITASSNTICIGDSVTLDANNVSGYSYQWNINNEQLPGAISSRLVSKNVGIFSVTETNNGCNATSSTITITKSSAVPKPTITVSGSILTSNALNGNQWFRDGVAIAGANSQVYNATSSGNYSVQITQNGCKSAMSDSYSLVVTGVVFIDNTQFIKLSPNPVKNEMILDFKIYGIHQLNIDLFDLNGRLVKQWHDQTKGSRLYLSNYSSAVYIARIYSTDGKINGVLKIIHQ